MKTVHQKIIFNNSHHVLLTLKRHAFNLFEQPSNNLWSFDLEGRPLGMFLDGNHYRRSLDNCYYHKSREKIDDIVYRRVHRVPESIATGFLETGHKLLRCSTDKIYFSFKSTVDKILAMNSQALLADADKFRKTYLPISILPPDQYLSLVVQITEGCNFNQCLFCNFYKDRPFRIKSRLELNKHLDMIIDYFGDGLQLRKSIFLGDANALITPAIKLIPMLETIRQKFPGHPHIFSFIDIFTGIKKTASDFKLLRELGLKRVYLGLESGYKPLLKFLHKPQDPDTVISLIKVLKKAEIELGVIFMAGAGGEKYHPGHIADTVKLVEKLALKKGDLVYISELKESTTDYLLKMSREKIPIPTNGGIRRMSEELKSALKSTVPKDVKIPVYDIQQFFY